MTVRQGAAVAPWALALTALGIALATTWQTQAELPMSPALLPDFRLEGFAPGSTLRQTAIAARDGLVRIDVGVAAAPASALTATVRASGGRVLATHTFQLPAAAVRRDLALRFEAEPHSRGQTYTVDITTPAGAAAVPIEALATDGLRDGQFIDPVRSLADTRTLDMNVRLYGRRTFGEVLTASVTTEPKVGIAGLGLAAVLVLGGGALGSVVWRGRRSLAFSGVIATLSIASVLVVRALIGFA